MIDAFQHDDGVVGEQPHGDRQCAERHQVKALARGIEPCDARQQRKRDAERQDPDAAACAQHPEEHGHSERAAEDQIPPQVRADHVHEMSLVVGMHPMHAGGQLAQRIVERGLDRPGDGHRRGAGLFEYGERHAGPAIEQDRVVGGHRGTDNARQVAQRNRTVWSGHGNPLQVRDAHRQAARFDEHILMTEGHVASRAQ